MSSTPHSHSPTLASPAAGAETRGPHIALYNTMGKLVSAVMTDVLTYLTEHHHLLPNKCFGGLPGRTTMDSLLYLINNIKNAWRKRKVATIVFLDIARVFPNTVTERLLANMVRLGYPTQVINYFEAVLDNRHTVLSFNGYVSEAINIDNGIGQGEPSSMILYLIYSHTLVGIPPTCGGNGGAYVDDNFFTAIGDTFEECDTKINQMLDKQEIWSAAHNSHAELSKFRCVRFKIGRAHV